MNIKEERSAQMVDIYIYVFKYKFVLNEIKYTILYNICIPITGIVYLRTENMVFAIYNKKNLETYWKE